MFENLKDESFWKEEALKVIGRFTPEQLAQFKADFNASGDRHACVTREENSSLAGLTLRLENVNGIVWLTVLCDQNAAIFCANECEELFQ